MDLYKNTYRSDTFRIKNWDYGSPGYYYVTICTKNREHYFGEVVLWQRIENDNYSIGETRAGDGPCGGIVGTHNYASLPSTPHPPHGGTHRISQVPVTRLTEIGRIAHQNWIDIPIHFPFVTLDEFVMMPNHIHGVLCFHKPGYRGKNVNRFGPQSQNLGSVIRNYKSATKTHATLHHIDFSWQARYHDNVITSGKELDNIRSYIRSNPARWLQKQKKKYDTI